MFRFQRCCVAVLVFVSAASARADEFFFRDGDVVVMIGDSITEQHLYSNYVEMWTVTRHPNWKLTFRNVGIGGDRSVGGNARFTRDVLLHKPTAMIVDFGMNDARTILELDSPDEVGFAALFHRIKHLLHALFGQLELDVQRVCPRLPEADRGRLVPDHVAFTENLHQHQHEVRIRRRVHAPAEDRAHAIARTPVEWRANAKIAIVTRDVLDSRARASDAGPEVHCPAKHPGTGGFFVGGCHGRSIQNPHGFSPENSVCQRQLRRRAPCRDRSDHVGQRRPCLRLWGRSHDRPTQSKGARDLRSARPDASRLQRNRSQRRRAQPSHFVA